MWENKYKVSYNTINNQHKNLFNLIDDITNLYISKNIKNDIQKILNKLLNYTMYHFTYEESIFELNNIDITEHKKKHKEFIEKIHIFENIINEKNYKIKFKHIVDMNAYLVEWLINHIFVEEKKLFNNIDEKQTK